MTSDTATQAGAPSNSRLITVFSLRWREILLLFLLIWTLAFQAYRGGANPDSPLTSTDFRVFYEAGARLNEGVSLYAPPASYGQGVYIYLPMTAVVMRPLAKLPPFEAHKLWTAANVLFLLASIALFALASNFRWRDTLSVGIMLLLGFRFWPTSYNLALGQVNFIALFLLCAMFYAQRKQQWIMFGVLIALAALLKTWFIGLLLYLILQRQWRAAAIGSLSFAALVVLAFSIVGWKEWASFIHYTTTYSSQPWIVSQSLNGFARLHFASNMHMQPLVNSQAAYLAFIIIGYGLFAAAAFRIFRRPLSKESSSTSKANLTLGFFILTFILSLPFCHMEYFLFALPLFWTILTWGTRTITPSQTVAPLVAIAGTILTYLLFTRPWPISGPALLAYSEGLKTLIPSMYFFGGCALWLITLYLLCRPSHREASNEC